MERAIEILVLAAVVGPFLRLCLSRPFIQKMRWFRGVAAGLVAAFLLYISAITLAAIYAPLALRVMAIAAVILCLAGWWRARPSYGRARGLPPGTLALAPLGPWIDDLDYAKRGHRYGPVFKMSRFLEPIVCIVGLPLARDLLRKHDDDLIVPPLPFTRLIPRGFLRYMQPRDHRPYAALFRDAFASGVIDDRAPAIAQIIRRNLDRFAADTASRDDVAPRPYLTRMMFTVFVDLFFGIDQDSEDFAILESAYGLIRSGQSWHVSARTRQNAVLEIEEVLRRQIARYSAPDASTRLPNCFLAEAMRSHPGEELDQTAIRNLTFILLTSSGDVTGLLHWVLKMLSDHPQWVHRLQAELGNSDDARSAGGIAERTVRETLRLEQSEYLMRRTKRTIRWNGFVLPRGWLVRVCVRESHRSAEIFDRPDAFDPDRFLRHRIGPAELSPFGMTHVSCLGEHLTLTVARTFISELAGAFDLTTIADGPREYLGFHWRPSSQLRVRLTARQPQAVLQAVS
jgi:cytochrome P450